MPESGSSGSVGEPPGNRRLYPDALYLTRILTWSPKLDGKLDRRAHAVRIC